MFEGIKTKINAAKELRSWWRDLPTVTIRGIEAKWIRSDPIGNATLHGSGMILAASGRLPGIGPFIMTDEFWEWLPVVTQNFILCHEVGHLLAGHCTRYARQGVAKLLKGMPKEDVAMSNRRIGDEFVADEMAANIVGAAGAVVALKQMRSAIHRVQNDLLLKNGDLLSPVEYNQAIRDIQGSSDELSRRITHIEDAMWAGEISA